MFLILSTQQLLCKACFSIEFLLLLLQLSSNDNRLSKRPALFKQFTNIYFQSGNSINISVGFLRFTVFVQVDRRQLCCFTGFLLGKHLGINIFNNELTEDHSNMAVVRGERGLKSDIHYMYYTHVVYPQRYIYFFTQMVSSNIIIIICESKD